MSKSIIIFPVLFISYFSLTTIVFGSTIVTKNSEFSELLKVIIKNLITLFGIISSLFFAWGSYSYISSSNNNKSTSKSKKIIFFSAIGLALTICAFFLNSILVQMAQESFGK